MEDNETCLSKEDLDLIKLQRHKLQVAELQRYCTELELKNTILQMYVKYKLDQKDSIEESTGKIIRQ